MDDKFNKSKLDTTLVHGQKPKTSTREKTQIIKFRIVTLTDEKSLLLFPKYCSIVPTTDEIMKLNE